jgi:hypothetical protein
LGGVGFLDLLWGFDNLGLFRRRTSKLRVHEIGVGVKIIDVFLSLVLPKSFFSIILISSGWVFLH